VNTAYELTETSATRRPRVLILSSEFPPGPGGIGTHAFELSRQLTNLGWSVTTITPQDYVGGDAVRRFNSSQPFRVVSLKPIPGAPIEAAYRLLVAAAFAVAKRPEVVVASGERAVWLAALLCGTLRIPLVAVGHAMEFRLPTRWERMLTRWSFSTAQGIVCVSEYTRNAMTTLGVQPPRGTVIPNGADDARFQALPGERVSQIRARLGLSGRRIIVTVGSVTHRKGQDVVIRALPEIIRRVPTAHYVIVGRPAKQAEFTELAASLGVLEHVTFAGQVDNAELVDIVNAADVFAMTSRHTPDGDFEGFGIAVAEAALCGKTAVVSAESGLQEAVLHDETGIVVPQSDHSATAEALIRLLTNDELRARLATSARTRAASELTWSRTIRRYDQFLRDITSRRL
jgi:phosphatidyl-myo-inositol dimannoside synthase